MTTGDEDMKLKNGLNVYIAFHIANDLDRVKSTKDIVETMSTVYGETSNQVFVDDEHHLIENTLKKAEKSDESKKKIHDTAKIRWEKFQEKKHSISGTEIIYKLQKPLMVSQETDEFFDNLQKVLSELNEYYPHFTQIDDKVEKGKGIE